MQPATHEVLSPTPHLLCEEHASATAADPLEEDWMAHDGAEGYARLCEEAVSDLNRFSKEGNHVTHYVLEMALTYLELYELPRARAELIKEGGKPNPTELELERLRFFDECASRWGWADAPGWVRRIRQWRADQEQTSTRG